MTYGSCVECSKKIGTALLELKAKRKPIAVLMDKNVESLTGFFGVVIVEIFTLLLIVICQKIELKKYLKLWNQLL